MTRTRKPAPATDGAARASVRLRRDLHKALAIRAIDTDDDIQVVADNAVARGLIALRQEDIARHAEQVAP